MWNVSLIDLSEDQLETFLSGGFDSTPVFADNGLQLRADVAMTGVDTKSVLSRPDSAQVDDRRLPGQIRLRLGRNRPKGGSRPGLSRKLARETWNVRGHLARLGADGARKWNVNLRRAMEICVDVQERTCTEVIEGVAVNDIILLVQMAVPTGAGRNPAIGMGSLKTLPRGIVNADDIMIC